MEDKNWAARDMSVVAAQQHAVARGSRQVEGFGTREIARQENSVAAAEAQATAAVQARYIMAARFPRDMDSVERQLLRECEREGFALTARYSRPVGGDQNASGWTIRFAEAAMRALNHIEAWAVPMREDEDTRTFRIGITDYQTNNHYSREVTIGKTVERSNPSGREVLAERTNSRGKPVYIIRAFEEEVAQKEAVAASKFWRSVIRLIPGDILDRCEAAVAKTIAAMPPEKQIEHMIDGFARLNVQVVDLQVYLGHMLTSKSGDGKVRYNVSAAEVEELRGVYTELRNGVRTWAQILDDKQPEGSAEEAARLAEEKISALKAQSGGSPAPEPAATKAETMAPPTDSGKAESGTSEPPPSRNKRFAL